MNLASIWPDTATNQGDHLWIGGCDTVALAEQCGTPLYLYDVVTLRSQAQAYQAALAQYYPQRASLTYAAKAWLNLALVQLWRQMGLGMDVVSEGELTIALRGGIPAAHIHFHGNNKSPTEIAAALDAGAVRIVLDGMDELALVGQIAASRNQVAEVWLRLTPDIDVHTHAHVKTGLLDSKFGLPISTGDATTAVAAALSHPNLQLIGLHTHLGSQVFDPEPLAQAAAALIEFAGQMQAAHGWWPSELCPGGGLGVRYSESDPVVTPHDYVTAVAQAVVQACRQARAELPHLVLEPGRSLVARAGVALYRVGAIKQVAGVRTYIGLDGGLADNPRPALYGARYSPVAANRLSDPITEVVTLAGPYCETGDIILKDVQMSHLHRGDLVALATAGAYHLSMASNYNACLRPAVVWVEAGQSRLVQRRETLEDLLAREESYHGLSPTA